MTTIPTVFAQICFSRFNSRLSRLTPSNVNVIRKSGIYRFYIYIYVEVSKNYFQYFVKYSMYKYLKTCLLLEIAEIQIIGTLKSIAIIINYHILLTNNRIIYQQDILKSER